jgi:hypothetical protein
MPSPQSPPEDNNVMPDPRNTQRRLRIEVSEGPDPDAVSAPEVNSFGYFLRPPAWLGGSLDEGSVGEPRAVWDRVEHLVIPHGISTWCFRNGLVVFNLASWKPGAPTPAAKRGDPEAIRARLRWRTYLLNTHLACLYTSCKRRDRNSLSPMALAANEVINIQDDGAFGVAGDLAGPGLVRLRWTTADGPPPAGDWRFDRAAGVSTAALRDSYELLSSVLRRPDGGEEVLPLVDLALRSAVAHTNNTFDASLIQSWALIERVLTSIWESYLDDNRQRDVAGQTATFITADRKKLLTGRDVTISVVSEMLSLLELLPHELYERLAEPRRARNGWMHELKPIRVKASAQSLTLAFELLRFAHGIDLDPVPDGMFGQPL